MSAPKGGPPESLAAFRLPSTDALDGRAFTLSLTGGGEIALKFTEPGRAEWIAGGVQWAGSGIDPVDVVEVASGTYFIDVDFGVPALESVTIILREPTGWALVVHQRRFHPEETWSRGPEVTQEFTVGRIVGSEQVGEAPATTRDLIGKRHFYRYSPSNLYEHIYLNSRKFCGHNVHTFGTPGRADCHPATYYKIDENLYVFAWREYDSAVAMVSFLNMTTLRATAKAHAPEHFLRSSNRAIGGHIIPATGDATYPDGLEPL